MNEVECIISSSIVIDGKDYYVVKEKISNTEHYIPFNQINLFKSLDIRKPYTFIKEYKSTINKTFYSIVHPNYKIGKELFLDVVSEFEENDKRFFILKSDYNDNLTVGAFDWQKQPDKIQCKVVGYKRGKPKLRNIENISTKWIINEKMLFKVKGFSQCTDKKLNKFETVVIEIDEYGEQQVRACQWHKKDLWKFNDIECKITGLCKNGLPKLMIVDERHPKYKVGKIYKFIINKFLTKTLYNNDKREIIDLLDNSGCSYEVNAISNQKNKLNIGDEIECEVEEISTRLKLKQVNFNDPFYYKFEDIINDIKIKQEYFDPYLNEDNGFNARLKSQYTQGGGFWIFTYCNQILPKIKSDLTKTYHYKEILDVLYLHTKLEEWILNKEITHEFSIEEIKSNTTKVKRVLVNNSAEIDAINFILNHNKQHPFQEQYAKSSLKGIYFFIKYSEFFKINEYDFLKFILELKDKVETTEENSFYIKKLIQHIHKSKKQYREFFSQDYFILSNNFNIKNKSKIYQYINWLYIEIILNKIINLNEEVNLLISELYRQNSFLTPDNNVRKKLLLNSFYIVSHSKEIFNSQVITKDRLEINIDQLENNPNPKISIDTNKKYYITKITDKYYKGFKILIDKVNGILPTQNIVDSSLKNYNYSNIDWTLHTNIEVYSKEFNLLIGKQLSQISEHYYSINNLKSKKIIKGTILTSKVKTVTGYGVFVSTEYGDGLIHISKVADIYLNKEILSKIFKPEKEIPVFLLNDNNDNKLELSFKDLIGTEYEKTYYDLIKLGEKINDQEINDEEISDEEISEDYNLDFKYEFEKGSIFEQYTIVETDITEKIKYLKFAQIFYSNIKDARSYLLTIYIEYFNSLIKLDNLIKRYTFDNYNSFRKEIIKIKEKVIPKTLETYPESKNLLFFIEILNLFNSQDENDIDTLFDLTKQSIEENDILLKAVAKNALANNLIISEIYGEDKSELDTFTLRNLKRIREYISQGVLSISDTTEDKFSRKLTEKRNLWKKRINQDEGQNLEFKSTFKTSVPSKETLKIIKNLEISLAKEKKPETIKALKSKIEKHKNQRFDKTDIERKLVHSALKTLCAFANTNGGCLLIGVSDDKKIFGLEQDYNSFKDKDRDGFGKYFGDKLKEYLGDSFASTLLKSEYLKFPEGDILILEVESSSEEIFLLKNSEGKKEESIYVRYLSASVKLEGIELAKFIKNRLRKQFIKMAE